MINIADWYWIVANSTTEVWSSKRAMSVPVDDTEYVAWGGYPTLIASMEELYDVFRVQFPAGSLPTYNADARYRKASGGLIVSSISPAAFYTDPVSRNTLSSANEYAKAMPHDTDWKFADGTFLPLTPAQLDTAANAVASFVQSCFTKESENLAAITGGTITTIAQIDATFSSIPSTVP